MNKPHAQADDGFERPTPKAITGVWSHPAEIAVNNFKFKSLSNFSFNTAVGCGHGCRFCYVPDVSTIKQAGPLAKLGVDDPDAQWGDYVFVRPWDEKAFLASLKKAQEIPLADLKADGNRAVMFCTTTDPYQVIKNTDPKKSRELTEAHQKMVRRAMELIRDESSLNVRILTRSPLAKIDFELFQSFGNRLVFGMSLPTLNDRLARIYEPTAPAPSQRLATLKAAKDAGLHVYVAIAPTYPECDEADLRATLTAIKELDLITIFHEPINIRAENVARISAHAEKLGVKLNTEVFATVESWEDYALGQLRMVERVAGELGLQQHLHLWPDKSFESKRSLARHENDAGHPAWLRKWWDRLSEWPGKEAARRIVRPAVGAVAPARADGQGMLFKALQQIAVPCTELSGQEIPECQPVLDDWFMEGDYGIIHGDRGVGKTFLVLSMAVAISGGGKCGPWKTDGAQKTLYVDGEMPHGEIDKRLQGLGAGENLRVAHHEALFQHAEATFNLADPAQQNDLARYINEEGVRVVILDNLSVLFPSLSANNDNDDWEPIKRWLLSLRRRKISVILVGHNGSNGELRGGTRKQDDAAWVIRLDRPAGMEGDGAMFESQFTKNRHAQRDPADVKWGFITNKDGITNVSATTTPEAEFRRLVESGETSATKIAEKLGVEKGTVAKWAKAGVEAGWMKIDGKGNKGKYVPV